MKRSYPRKTWGRSYKAKHPYQRRKYNRGIIPTYRGWQPRNFQLGEWKYFDTHADNVTADTTGAGNTAPRPEDFHNQP